MGIDAAALLAGPRGRRVCLEVARPRPAGAPAEPEPLAEPDPLAEALFLAALERSTGAVVVFSRAEPGEQLRRGRAEPPPASTLEELARMIHERAFATPDASRLSDALGVAVRAARYWQEPDGDDQVAQHPEVAHALAGAAAAIARSEAASWWATAVERSDQWSVAFDAGSDGHEARRVEPAREVLATWRERFDHTESALRRRDHLDGPFARLGSDWWSIPPRGLRATTRGRAEQGAVGLRLVEDPLDWRSARLQRMSVHPGARVFEVGGPERWAELCARFPLDATASRRAVWELATGRDGRWLIPDWPRVAEEFDGVHVSVLGYLSTAGSAVPVADGWATVLAGWDPDQTYWLTDAAVRAHGETTGWDLGDDGEWRMRCTS